MRAVIKQLARRMSELPADIEQFYDNASSPGDTELQNSFIQISRSFKQVFFGSRRPRRMYGRSKK